MNGDCPGCGGRPYVFLYELDETLVGSINRFEAEVSCPRCRIGVRYRGIDVERAREGALLLWARVGKGGKRA